jgi:hypothetical protein
MYSGETDSTFGAPLLGRPTVDAEAAAVVDLTSFMAEPAATDGVGGEPACVDVRSAAGLGISDWFCDVTEEFRSDFSALCLKAV